MALLLAGPVTGQAFVGRILDEATGSAVALASIGLLDSSGNRLTEIVADTAGRFRVVAPGPGTYHLHVSALGYQSVNTREVRLDTRVELQVELRLSASAVPVEPLRVVARRTYTALRLRDFYKRMDWSSKSGFGDVLSYEDIQRMQAPSIERVFNSKSVYAKGQPGQRGLVSRSTCDITVFLDGQEVTFDELNATPPELLEGIELYKNRFDIPPEYLNRAGCGLALAWTRVDGGSRLTWKKLALGAGLATGILLISLGGN